MQLKLQRIEVLASMDRNTPLLTNFNDSYTTSDIAAIMTPIIIVLILMVGGAALFVAFRKTQL